MNILLISDDERLVQELEREGSIQVVRLLSAQAGLAAGNLTKDRYPHVIAVSDRLCLLDDAIQLRELYTEAAVFYLIGNRDDVTELKRIRSLCEAHGIRCILPYRTVKQIAARLIQPDEGNYAGASKLIACVAALPQLGLTTSVLRLAVRLGELTGMRIGVLGLNGWNPGDSAIPYKGKYLDDLWGSLQGTAMTADELAEKMHPLSPQVRYLAGNRDWKKLYYYSPDGVERLIELAKQRFDVILADAGCYLDHALAAQPVCQSDIMLLQLDQSLQAREQWERTKAQIVLPVLGCDPSKIFLWFNQMQRTAELEHEKQLARQLGLPYVGSLPYLSSMRTMEAERNALDSSDPAMNEPLDKVCRALIRYYELPTVYPAAGRKAAWSGTSLLARLFRPAAGGAHR